MTETGEIRATARALVDMGRAHEFHRPEDRRSLVNCKGISDPLSGHFCQFSGTPQEWYDHVIERAAAVLVLGESVQQYGVQIVWIDPVEAGAAKVGEDYVPKWSVFETEEQADSFASIYTTYLEAGPHNGVAAVNRGRRWSVERYGSWTPDPRYRPGNTSGGDDRG